MACYNGEKYIKQQIDSILSQLSREDELIISDDNSIDKTIEIIEGIHDSRIILVHHKQDLRYKSRKYKNGYLCSQNFQSALEASRGNYIFLSDQDDIWINGRVNAFTIELEKHYLIMSNFSVINDVGRVLKNKYFDSWPFSRSLLGNITRNPFFGCAMAFRREVLNYALPIPRECVSYDLWIGCLAASKYDVCFINYSWHLYRRHGRNISNATGKSTNSIWFKICWRLKFIYLYIIKIVINKVS